MHLHHPRIQHWVIDWLYLGLICGVVAAVNILARSVSPDTLTLILFFAGLAWLIGGIVCYGFDGLNPLSQTRSREDRSYPLRRDSEPLEWHCASDFVLPGCRRIRQRIRR